MKPDALKVLIYATWCNRLTVFDVPLRFRSASFRLQAALWKRPSPLLPFTTIALPRTEPRFGTDGTTSTLPSRANNPPPGCVRKWRRSAAVVQSSSVSSGSNFDDARTWLGYGMQHGLPCLAETSHEPKTKAARIAPGGFLNS